MGRVLSTRRQLGVQDKHLLLFDTSPGTKTFVVPPEISGLVPVRLRIAVVGGGGCGFNGGGSTASGGAGGGYSEYYKTVNTGDSFGYIVGAGSLPTWGLLTAGTSSFNGEISATGGTYGSGYGASGGMGYGGVINSRGGSVVGSSAQVSGGAGPGHRNGDGPNVIIDSYGGLNAKYLDGTGFLLDGFGLGTLPNSDNRYGMGGLGGLKKYENGKTVFYGENGGAGAGAGSGGGLTIDVATQSMYGGRAGIGGGGAMSLWGSGQFDGTPGGNGAVIIEMIDWR